MESNRNKIVIGAVLALIGALISTFVGWIPNPFAASSTGEVRPVESLASSLAADDALFLEIEGVDVFGRPVGPLKVTALVNGTPFEYPSLGGVEWIEAGPSMSSQSFQLPSGMEHAEIRFEMRTLSGAAFVSQSTERVAIPGDLPHAGTYKLHRLNEEVGSRAAPVTAEVHYRLGR